MKKENKTKAPVNAGKANKVKANKVKVNKGLIIKCAVAVVLLAGIAVGTVLGLDWYYVDTPYDGIRLPKYITVAKYFGAELSETEVKEALDDEIQAILDEYTIKTTVKKGTIAKGQNVTVTLDCYDYTNGVKGDKIDDISVTGYEITNIGEHEDDEGNKYFPELQDKLIGVAFDFENEDFSNTVTLKHTYPDDYNIDDLKGKTVMHYVYITKVTDSNVPEYNDELFASHSDELGYKTVKEFEDYMINQIELNLLWNNIVKQSTVIKYPEKKTQPLKDEFDAYYNQYMSSNQLTFEQLLTQLGTTESGYLEAKNSYAEGTVKEEMILYEIIQAEKIRLSKSEYNERVAKLASDSGYANVTAFVEDYGKEVAYRSCIWEKVKEMILERAVRVD